ncbi:MAG: hypothetical protein INH43_24725, partial [Acidobacteriaceae bacterium]|nr:hypothetical protein [Acidobacteriaceae bacterium]
MSFRRDSLSVAIAFLTVGTAFAQTSNSDRQGVQIELELDRLRFERNEIQRPNDGAGDRFSGLPFTGESMRAARLSIEFPVRNWGENHRLRIAYVPLSREGVAKSDTPIRFQGSKFDAGSPIDLKYKFDTWRFTYSVPVFDTSSSADEWTFRAGGTLAIRDAQIRLQQGEKTEDFPNRGPVPLLYFSARRELGRGWAVEGEFDGFPAPGGGGLFDGTARLTYAVSRSVTIVGGARYIVGAAVDPSIYNSLSTVSATIATRFS